MEMDGIIHPAWRGRGLKKKGALKLKGPAALLIFLGSPALAAGPSAASDGWPLGDFLLVAMLVFLVLGWLGGYGLLLAWTGPLIKRRMLYPLLAWIGRKGKKKPLIRWK